MTSRLRVQLEHLRQPMPVLSTSAQPHHTPQHQSASHHCSAESPPRHTPPRDSPSAPAHDAVPWAEASTVHWQEGLSRSVAVSSLVSTTVPHRCRCARLVSLTSARLSLPSLCCAGLSSARHVAGRTVKCQARTSRRAGGKVGLDCRLPARNLSLFCRH